MKFEVPTDKSRSRKSNSSRSSKCEEDRFNSQLKFQGDPIKHPKNYVKKNNYKDLGSIAISIF